MLQTTDFCKAFEIFNATKIVPYTRRAINITTRVHCNGLIQLAYRSRLTAIIISIMRCSVLTKDISSNSLQLNQIRSRTVIFVGHEWKISSYSAQIYCNVAFFTYVINSSLLLVGLLGKISSRWRHLRSIKQKSPMGCTLHNAPWIQHACPYYLRY